MSKLLFVDVQAAGSPGSGFLLEVAWKSENSPGHSFFIRRPGVEIPVRIQSITGISAEDLSSMKALPEVEVRNLFLAAAGLHPGQTPVILVAHYAVFEKKWLDFFTGLNLEFICTRNMAREQLMNLQSGSLRAVAGYTGFSMGEKRRAMEHVLATEAVFHALVGGFDTVLPERDVRLSLPGEPGIYRFYDVAEKLLYVGKAKNLKNRVNSHFTGKSHGRHAELISRVSRIEHQVLESAFHAAVRESEIISSLAPEYNSAGRIRTETLWFLSPDLTEVVQQNQRGNCFGPFVSPHPAVEFSLLVRSLYSDEMFPEIVENLMENPPLDLVCRVLTEWKMQVLEQGILQYGKELFANRCKTDDEEHSNANEVIGEQHIRVSLDSLAAAGSHLCRKAAAVRLLEGCSVSWSCIADEGIVHNYVDNSLSENWDQAKVRKLQVVLSEIRRVYKTSSRLKIVTASGKILTEKALNILFRFL